MTINSKRLRELLDYDPESGVFCWKVDRSRLAKVGTVAGCYHPNYGYHMIRVCGRCYRSHRLAWLYIHGRWPKGYIDHINGDVTDNRIENLRDCNAMESARNRKTRKDSRLGITGVHLTKSGRYHAAITLGTFGTLEEAKKAYNIAAKKIHGEFYYGKRK